MSEWGFEPGIRFQCPKCKKRSFIEGVTLRELWEDDEFEVRKLLGIEAWTSVDDDFMEFLSVLPTWVKCPKCHKKCILFDTEDEDVEESGYGGNGVVLQ